VSRTYTSLSFHAHAAQPIQLEIRGPDAVGSVAPTRLVNIPAVKQTDAVSPLVAAGSAPVGRPSTVPTQDKLHTAVRISRQAEEADLTLSAAARYAANTGVMHLQLPPMQLVRKNVDQNCLEVNEAVVTELMRVVPRGEPLHIISIAGDARTGKSFLMNMLMGEIRGFDLGPNLSACTLGIWMWYKQLNGKNIVLLDTEGLNHPDADTGYDNKVLALVVLLSSLFVLNVKGSVHTHSIKQLSFVVELVKRISNSSVSAASASTSPVCVSGALEQTSESGASAAEEHKDFKVSSQAPISTSKDLDCDIAAHFPALLYVIRDFFLNPGDGRTPNDVFNDYLTIRQKKTPENEVTNATVTAVRKYFSSHTCKKCVVPIHGEEQLQNIDSCELSDLRPEFLRDIEEVRRFIMDTARPKQTMGCLWNTDVFAHMLRTYVSTLNGSAHELLTPLSTFRDVANRINERSIQRAVQTYDREFDQLLATMGSPLAHEELLRVHSTALERALADFCSDAVVGMEDDAQQRSLLQDQLAKYDPTDPSRVIGGKLLARVQDNEKVSRMKCERVLQTLWREAAIEEKIVSGAFAPPHGSVHDYRKARYRILDEYRNAKAMGPCINEVYMAFNNTKKREVELLIMQNTQLTQAQSDRVKLEEELTSQALVRDELRRHIEDLQLTTLTAASDHAVHISQLRKDMQDLEVRKNEEFEEKSRSRIEEVKRHVDCERDADATAVLAELEALKAQHSQEMERMEKAQKQTQLQYSSLEHAIREAKLEHDAELAAEERRNLDLVEAWKSEQIRKEQSAAKTNKELEQRLKALKSEQEELLRRKNKKSRAYAAVTLLLGITSTLLTGVPVFL